jgi:hypothetical protein
MLSTFGKRLARRSATAANVRNGSKAAIEAGKRTLAYSVPFVRSGGRYGCGRAMHPRPRRCIRLLWGSARSMADAAGQRERQDPQHRDSRRLRGAVFGPHSYDDCNRCWRRTRSAPHSVQRPRSACITKALIRP